MQIEADISALNTQIKTLISKGNQINSEVAALNKKVVNTEAAIEGINRIIRTSGFQGFSLKAKDGVQNTYEVIRPDGSVAEKLSEGERNFIAFLYFYHLVKGSYSSEIGALNDLTQYLTDEYMRALETPRGYVLIARNEPWEQGCKLREVLRPQTTKLRYKLRDLYRELHPEEYEGMPPFDDYPEDED